MIISEKQIFKLIDVAKVSSMHPSWSVDVRGLIIALLKEIEDQQSEELKVVE